MTDEEDLPVEAEVVSEEVVEPAKKEEE